MTTYSGTTRMNTTTVGRVERRTSTAKTNGRMLKIIVAVLVLAFVLVGLQAYTATLQHANNILESDNAYLQAEIDSMQEEIVEQTKVTSIEKTATQKYGMVYPTSDNCVTIHEGEDMATDLAATIKSEAYN